MENGMGDVREGCIRTIDLDNKRGVIEVATSDDGAPRTLIQFSLADLRVSEDRDLRFLREKTKVSFRLRNDESSVLQAHDVIPIGNALCYAQVYAVAEDYCRVLILDCHTLANVNLSTLKLVVPHQFCLSAKENCVVAFPWTEFREANAQKRLPVVHLLELFDSRGEAEAALENGTVAEFETMTAPALSAFRGNIETSSDAPSIPRLLANGDFVTGNPWGCPRDHLLGHDWRGSSEGASTPLTAPTRDQLQMAYWSGVRDGALRHRQLMSPYCSSVNPALNELSMKYRPANRIFHHC